MNIQDPLQYTPGAMYWYADFNYKDNLNTTYVISYNVYFFPPENKNLFKNLNTQDLG